MRPGLSPATASSPWCQAPPSTRREPLSPCGRPLVVGTEATTARHCPALCHHLSQSWESDAQLTEPDQRRCHQQRPPPSLSPGQVVTAPLFPPCPQPEEPWGSAGPENVRLGSWHSRLVCRHPTLICQPQLLVCLLYAPGTSPRASPFFLSWRPPGPSHHPTAGALPALHWPPSFHASPPEALSAQALGTSAQSSLREAMPDSPQGTLKEGRGLACISKFAPRLECLQQQSPNWKPSNACWRMSCGGRSGDVPCHCRVGGQTRKPARCGIHSPGVQKRHNCSGLSEVGVVGTLGGGIFN